MAHTATNAARRGEFLAYLLGMGTALAIGTALMLFIGYRVGYGRVYTKARSLIAGRRVDLAMPRSVLAELTAANAVIGNAGNPTKRDLHDTFLVRPDPQLGHALRPGVTVYATTLRSRNAFDLMPPVLYTDCPVSELPAATRAYVAEHGRLTCTYTTDEAGFRNTSPLVRSSRTILLVGDSVAFGTGVSDEYTVASALQRMVGSQYRVLNAAVGAYTGRQAVAMARKLSDSSRFDALVYVACQNDFMHAEDWDEEAEHVIGELAELTERFHDNVFVVMHTFMPYNLRDVFLEKGWSEEVIGRTSSLRRTVASSSRRQGMEFLDWSDLVASFSAAQQSVFAGFGLYVDTCHLSPTGNALMATELHTALRRRGVVAE